MKQQIMDRAVLGDIELEFEVQGTGEPVMLIHAGVCADWFKNMMDEQFWGSSAL